MDFVATTDKNTTSNTTLIVAFFYRDGDSKSSTIALTLYQSLLHQFLSRDAELLQRFKVEIDFDRRLANEGERGSIWDEYELQLQQQCEKILAAIVKKGLRVTIYLDKIDELDERDAKALIMWLHQISVDTDRGVNLCFASIPFSRGGILNDFTVNIEKGNMRDIEKYIEANLTPYSRSRSDSERNLIQNVITKRTAGIFQWLVCNINDLQNMLQDGESAADISSGIEVLPKDLSDAYEVLMTKHLKHCKVEFAFRALWWITFAKRPLPIGDLKHAICIDPSKAFGGAPTAKISQNWCDNDSVFVDSILRMFRCFLTTNPIEPIETLSFEYQIDLWGSVSDEESHTNSELEGSMPASLCALQFNHESVSQFMIDRGLAMIEIQRSGKSVPKTIGLAHLSAARACLQHVLSDQVQ